MALKGLLLCAEGTLFVLLPGYLMFLLLRRTPDTDRSLIGWGAGGFFIALLPLNFLVALLRQILANAQGIPETVVQLLIPAFLTGFFVEGMKYLLLKLRHVSGAALVPSGMAVGLGVGFINQIFYGPNTLGKGLALLRGDSSTLLAETAARSLPELGLAAMATLAARVALLLMNACLGAVVGRAVLEKKRRFLGLAMLVQVAVDLTYGAVTGGLQGHAVLALWGALALECIWAVVGWLWLRRYMPLPEAASNAPKDRKRT